MATQKSVSKRTGDDATKRLRLNQSNQIATIISALQAKLAEMTNNQRKQLALLESVSLGLYEEVDKLSKKAPAELVTDLVLSQTNDVIRETKQLVADDSYIQRISEFVAAGDNPQHRDVVVVLRQIRQGLARFKENLSTQTTNIQSRLKEAQLISVALYGYINGHDVTERFLNGRVDVDDIDFLLNGFTSDVPRAWLDDDKITKHFNFARLDKLDLDQYFLV